MLEEAPTFKKYLIRLGVTLLAEVLALMAIWPYNPHALTLFGVAGLSMLITHLIMLAVQKDEVSK